MLPVPTSSWKRANDVIWASILLVVTFPILVLTTCILVMMQGRPVFFCQRRVGLFGQPFTLIKFRTMTAGSPLRYPDIPVGKSPNDPRVTPIGRFLRRFAIDELPQLINVIRGEMSLVGPRPLPVEDLVQPEWLATVPPEARRVREEWVQHRHEVLPGLTGLWQVSPYPVEDFDNWIACDLAYVTRHTWCDDARILFCTPFAVLRGRMKATTATQDSPVCRQSSEDAV